uniref:NADH dehydrogenase subunit 4L n=1 Tax=Exoristobia philippinensis TaxID=3081681 RepID=UPI002A81FBF7|nr:NADH dehydrogenase subunit 4L [Exoristobia philippinensis]WOE90356.1 NADH dehydrogenase subunit 4L [Exoristobia philippinensis]
MFLNYYLYSYMFIINLFMFSCFYNFLMLTLMSLEFLMLSILSLLILNLSMINLENFIFLYLIFVVCESVLGLTLLLMLIRSKGNDNTKILSMILW